MWHLLLRQCSRWPCWEGGRTSTWGTFSRQQQSAWLQHRHPLRWWTSYVKRDESFNCKASLQFGASSQGRDCSYTGSSREARFKDPCSFGCIAMWFLYQNEQGSETPDIFSTLDALATTCKQTSSTFGCWTARHTRFWASHACQQTIMLQRWSTTGHLNMSWTWWRRSGTDHSACPYQCKVDPDGCFLGPNQEWHQNLGIEHLVIPPEEAWRLGKIGRRNALVRTLAERLIDQNGATKKTDLDDILVAVLHSINTSTYSYGRSPCQAVFGRIPRPSWRHSVRQPGLDNLTTSTSGAWDTQTRTVEGLKLWRLLPNFQLRRQWSGPSWGRHAPRKIFLTFYLDKPWHTGAWVARLDSTKRGAWNLARFLAWDPDKKSAWVQVGKHSVRVGATQLRAASGWENWTPSESDLKLIKDAKNDIANGLWLEDAGAAPDEEEHLNADEEIFEFPARKRKLGDVLGAEDVNLEEEPETPYPQEELPASAGSSQPYNLSTVPVSAERSLQHLQHQHAPEEPEPSQPSQLQLHHQLEPVSGLPQLPSVPPGTLYQHLHQATTHQHQQTQQNIQFNLQHRLTHVPELWSSAQLWTFASNTSQPWSTISRPANYTPCWTEYAFGKWRGIWSWTKTSTDGWTTPVADDQDSWGCLWYLWQWFSRAKGSSLGWESRPQESFLWWKQCIQHLPGQLCKEDRNGTCRRHYTDIGRPDEDTSDDEEMQLSNQRGLTRQEMKQLDREIPWREIVNLPLMMRRRSTMAGWIGMASDHSAMPKPKKFAEIRDWGDG